MRLRGRLVVAPSVRYLDVAHDAAKYGRISDEPWLEATIPSLIDPLLVDGAAASGVRHVMSVLVQSAPRQLRDGDWDDRLATPSLQRTMAVLESVAPGIGGLVVARQVHTPADLERDLGTDRWSPAPRRAESRPVVRVAADARLRPIPDAARRPLPVRLGGAPGWRRHGRTRAQRGARGRSPTAGAATA